MPKRVLVTGGAGFIGSHLVEALVAAGDEVTVTDDLSTGTRGNLDSVRDSIHLVEHDLAAVDLRPILRQFSFATIYHLAGNGYVPPSIESPRLDFRKNALATLELLDAVRDASPSTAIVYTSTAAVYGDGSNEPIAEDHPTLPVAPYGVSKLAAERYLAVYARLFGLRTASARLFPVYGPRLRKQVVYDLVAKVLSNPDELPIYGDGSQIRDFNAVSNVVAALQLIALRAPLTGEVYNVASGTPIAIRTLVDLICDHLQVDPTRRYSGEVRPGDAHRWSADLHRIQALGYRPIIGLDDGLAEYVGWIVKDRSASMTAR